MRTIERTAQFRRDYKREEKGKYRHTLATELIAVITVLVNDQGLAEKFCDHALVGKLKGFRDCHVKPDLVLIYRKTDKNVLQLIRLGSHRRC